MEPNFLSFNNKSTEVEEIPERTGEIKSIFIQEKLASLGVDLNDINLGLFDEIGEFTAKKKRSKDSPLYNSVGAFFRPNYERGILIYSLIKKYNIRSFLEIGFGRGYSTFCAAMALHENGGGKIVTVDPNFNKEHIEMLTRVFPREWFEMITFQGGTSYDYLSNNNDKFDFVYIDGDHTYQSTKSDWLLCKDRYEKLLLFDDYHLPGKIEKNIECANLIDQIDDDSKELIIMDRRIFFDDRRISDEEIDYGQVLLTRGQ